MAPKAKTPTHDARASNGPRDDPAPARPSWSVAALLFVLSLVVRLLFLHASSDAAWPYSVHYKGDALVWLQAVDAARSGAVFEFGLPFRPPAMAWLVDLAWDGSAAGFEDLNHLWSVLGALSVALLYLAAVPLVGRRAGAIAGALAAFANGWMVIATSLNNELPYLVLFLASMVLAPRGFQGLKGVRAGGWAVLQALACLVRVEHVLFFALAWLHGAWRLRSDRARLLSSCGLTLGLFGLTLLPWQLEAAGRVASFNRGELTRSDASVAGMQARFAHVRWTPEAEAALQSLPAFARDTSRVFVAATLDHRGQDQVRAGDLEVLRQAYGVLPEALGPRPFVACYGGLNFYLANQVSSSGGFERDALSARPAPLEGGAERYPPALVAAMPPERFSLEYPPHLELLNHGYARGMAGIAAAPLAWLGLAARKLDLAWTGASLGYTGFDLPLGSSGVRRAVDLLVPAPGPLHGAWRLAVLGLVVFGLVRIGSGERTELWWIYAASKLVAVTLFFGYARQGVLLGPLVFIALAAALEALFGARWDRGKAWTWTVGAALSLGLGLELVRFKLGARATIDGVSAEAQDPVPFGEHRDHLVEIQVGQRRP